MLHVPRYECRSTALMHSCGPSRSLLSYVASCVVDKLEPGERCASTSNRNFEGRQGSGGRTHLGTISTIIMYEGL